MSLAGDKAPVTARGYGAGPVPPETKPAMSAEDAERWERLLKQARQGGALSREEWLWMLTAELAWSETRQDRGYDLKP